jgi:hypothetical protein
VVGLSGLSLAGLVLHLSSIRNKRSYTAYIVAANEVSTVLASLETELIYFDHTCHTRRISDPRTLLTSTRVSGPLLLVDADRFDTTVWSSLDRQRSSLEYSGGIVFMISSPTFDLLMQNAPNLASWIVAYEIEREDVGVQRLKRLDALRQHFNRSDDDVVAAAMRGDLPRDPQFAEWLALLGRGDLLE